MNDAPLNLHRDAFGRLVLAEGGATGVPVVPVRAFALSAPDEGISLVGPDGSERRWIAHLREVPAPARALIEEALAVRDFSPVLQRLHGVSSYSVPSSWRVSTDRGETEFVLKAEEDIRRLHTGALLITSASGVQFRIPDVKALDRASQRMLERFL